MGFKASEAVEELTYDFRPHNEEHGKIPEPTSDQVRAYQTSVFDGIKASGLDPTMLTGGGSGNFSLDDLDNLLEQTAGLEDTMRTATAGLTQISDDVLAALPYRISRSFLGWIMGLFFDPEG